MRNRILMAVGGMVAVAGLAGCGAASADGLAVVPEPPTESAVAHSEHPAVANAVEVLAPLCPALSKAELKKEAEDFVGFLDNGADPGTSRQLLRENSSNLVSALKRKCGADWSDQELQTAARAVRQLIG